MNCWSAGAAYSQTSGVWWRMVLIWVNMPWWCQSSNEDKQACLRWWKIKGGLKVIVTRFSVQWHLGGQVGILHKNKRSMDRFCFAFCHWGCSLVWNGVNISSVHCGSLNSNWAVFHHHKILKYYCWPYPPHNGQCTHLLMASFSWIMSIINKVHIISNWFLELDNVFTVLQWTPQPSNISPVPPLGCDGITGSKFVMVVW